MPNVSYVSHKHRMRIVSILISQIMVILHGCQTARLDSESRKADHTQVQSSPMCPLVPDCICGAVECQKTLNEKISKSSEDITFAKSQLKEYESRLIELAQLKKQITNHESTKENLEFTVQKLAADIVNLKSRSEELKQLTTDKGKRLLAFIKCAMSDKQVVKYLGPPDHIANCCSYTSSVYYTSDCRDNGNSVALYGNKWVTYKGGAAYEVFDHADIINEPCKGASRSYRICDDKWK